MKWPIILFSFFVFLSLKVQPAQAFQYVNNQLTNSEFNSQNLLKNPWFRSSNCTFSGASWNLNDTTAGSEATWADSDKTQDPADPGQPNCNSDWWGFAARFAKGSGGIQFSSGKTAIMSQVVGESPTINPNDRTLHFHALMVAHRVYVFKAEIFGGNTKNGPWNLVWTPFNIVNCLTLDCVNATYGPACNQGDRQCLWDDVSSSPEILGTLDAKQQTISNGYPFYKIQFSMRYPDPNLDLQTGDVGGKVARVFFRVTGSGGTPPPITPSPTPTRTPTPIPPTPTLAITPSPSPTPPILISVKNLLLSWLTNLLDRNSDGKVNSFDFSLLIQTSTQPSNLIAGSGISYKDTLPTADELKVMADEVINEVNSSLGGIPPKLVIVYANAGVNVNVSGNMQNVGEYIRNQLNPSARLAGETTGADKYPSLTNSDFPAPDKRSLSVLALAGDSLQHIEMVTEQTANGNGRNAAEYLSDSQSIGNQLGNRILASIPDYQSKSNLLLITGPFHGDINVVEVLSGLTQGLTSAGVNTSFIKFFGAGGADNAGSSFNDNWQGGRSLTGVLLSGNFDLALSGQADFVNCPGGPEATSTNHLNNLKSQLGGAPAAVFYIPGHPNTQLCSHPDTQSVMNAMRNTIPQVFGEDVPAIGAVGGSEIGHYTTSGLPVGEVFHFFVAGLK